MLADARAKNLPPKIRCDAHYQNNFERIVASLKLFGHLLWSQREIQQSRFSLSRHRAAAIVRGDFWERLFMIVHGYR